MNDAIRLGISTCPNDTFAFCGLIERRVDWRGLDFTIELLDVQQLNERLFAGKLDVAKASFHAALLLSREYGVLPSGSALGFGVGPLLLSARAGTQPGDSIPQGGAAGEQSRVARVLCPGEHTTATLLYRLFHPDEGAIEHVVFSEIMPALEAGEADFGVCIHEGRFTWQDCGLGLVEDLGTVWEKATGAPLPLGGILARRDLGPEMLSRVQGVIRDSLDYGLRDREATLPFMRRYAQELSDEVIYSHVDLYVNDWTRDLGAPGRAALAELTRKATQVGIVPRDLPPLEVVGE